jgi:hypothetical protein
VGPGASQALGRGQADARGGAGHEADEAILTHRYDTVPAKLYATVIDGTYYWRYFSFTGPAGGRSRTT